jgi:hypothetical protein
MSLKPITVLRRARKLIADRNAWIKGSFIGKRKGAQCYCALGALATGAGVKVANGKTLSNADSGCLPTEYYVAHQLLRKAIGDGFQWVPSFNDDNRTQHADVLKMFDKAIELAKAESAASTPAA